MLVADLTKRYGNLSGGLIHMLIFINWLKGVSDIKNHRWFAGLDWDLLVAKKLPAPYKPLIK